MESAAPTAAQRITTHVHPLLRLVNVPGSGRGFRVTGGRIGRGEVLLTESAYCTGELREDGEDDAMVAQFLENMCDPELSSGAYRPMELSTSGGVGGADLLDPSAVSPANVSPAWVQRCLDNNVYQCRRAPRRSALFLAVARFNHSCDPSALNDADGTVANVRALRDLEEGEEVTISYVPVGWDLARRAQALSTFGFRCRCERCAKERVCDPAFSTPCSECGVGIRSMVLVDDAAGDASGIGDDPFAGRLASPCTLCGSGVPFAGRGSAVATRHAVVVAASAAVREVLACAADPERTQSGAQHLLAQQQRAQRQAEAALLVAPFATHPATLHLHRGLVRLLQVVGAQPQPQSGRGADEGACRGNDGREHRSSGVALEQLREIERLDRAHGGARHRDLHFLRCFARVHERCCPAHGGQQGADDTDSESYSVQRQLSAHVAARWHALRLTHFGKVEGEVESAAAAAPASFLEWAFAASAEQMEEAVRWLPIGMHGERLAVLGDDDEVSLSGYGIGDAGCAVLCGALGGVRPLRSLDLEANRLSADGGAALGAALGAGAAPLLAHLDLMGNCLGPDGVCALAAALAQSGCCPLLEHLDLASNGVGDAGCEALGAAFAAGAAPVLARLYLGENGIEDCSALAVLFRTAAAPGAAQRRCVSHLDLAQNLIEDCSCLFLHVVASSSLEHLNLDVSWNCLGAEGFRALRRALMNRVPGEEGATRIPALRLEGNVFSDRQCEAFCVALTAAGGAAPELSSCSGSSGGCGGGGALLERKKEVGWSEEEGAARGDDLKLRRCLRSLADGVAVNPRVSCDEDLWRTSAPPASLAADVVANDESATASDGGGSLRERLERDGFAVAPRLFQRVSSGAGQAEGTGVEVTGTGSGGGMAALSATVDRLERAGWPPVFCFMCDAVWELICGPLWNEMEVLLGADCVLEPSVFAWSLKHAGAASTGEGEGEGDGEGERGTGGVGPLSRQRKIIGQSFGLPHRDYTASEALFEDGLTPKLLNVWIPINDATLSNGCMRVVPREFDPAFARPDDPAHMRPAAEVRGAAVCKLRFGLHGAQALPAAAGSLLLWNGNTIHWGGSCSRYAERPPRKSIAMVFRRGDVAQLEGAGEPLTRTTARALSPDGRLALVASSLLLYQQWHSLHAAAVPDVIYETTSRW